MAIHCFANGKKNGATFRESFRRRIWWSVFLYEWGKKCKVKLRITDVHTIKHFFPKRYFTFLCNETTSKFILKQLDYSPSFSTSDRKLGLVILLLIMIFIDVKSVASETYIWSFHYRVLNYILNTNSKLFKMDLSLNDKCTFCGSSKKELYHLFFECSRV